MTRHTWSRILYVLGCAAILIGTLDPMEGSVAILAGALVALLALLLGGAPRRTLIYWTWSFALIAVGVAALFGWSAVGGIGGTSGHSTWWALTFLPYPIGWCLAIAAMASELVQSWKSRHHPATP